MQIKPVTKADKPEYPTASEIDVPKVLNASKPNKWKRNAAIGAVMVSLIISSSACTNVKSTKNIYQDNFTFVAPIFEHGDGRGTIACMASAPPVFITEADAKKIIFAEFEDAGIVLDTAKTNQRKIPLLVLSTDSQLFATDSVELDELKSRDNGAFWEKHSTGYKVETRKFSTDAFVEGNNIGIVFVSEKHINTFHQITSQFSKSIYSTKELSEKILKNSMNLDHSIVVFYDPIARVGFENEKRKKREIKLLEKSKDSLRAQVRDFLAWYKANKGKK